MRTARSGEGAAPETGAVRRGAAPETGAVRRGAAHANGAVRRGAAPETGAVQRKAAPVTCVVRREAAPKTGQREWERVREWRATEKWGGAGSDWSAPVWPRCGLSCLGQPRPPGPTPAAPKNPSRPRRVPTRAPRRRHPADLVANPAPSPRRRPTTAASRTSPGGGHGELRFGHDLAAGVSEPEWFSVGRVNGFFLAKLGRGSGSAPRRRTTARPTTSRWSARS